MSKLVNLENVRKYLEASQTTGVVEHAVIHRELDAAQHFYDECTYGGNALRQLFEQESDAHKECRKKLDQAREEISGLRAAVKPKPSVGFSPSEVKSVIQRDVESKLVDIETAFPEMTPSTNKIRELLARAWRAVPKESKETETVIEFMGLSETGKRAVQYLIDCAKTIVEKEKGYGDAAKSTVQVFAPDIDAFTRIRSRLDDKLTRIVNLGWRKVLYETRHEDTLQDFINYLVLMVASKPSEPSVSP